MPRRVVGSSALPPRGEAGVYERLAESAIEEIPADRLAGVTDEDAVGSVEGREGPKASFFAAVEYERPP